MVKIGEFFFRHRGITPIPFWFILFICSFYNQDSFSLLETGIGILLIVVGEAIRMFSIRWGRSITRTRSRKTGGRLIKVGPFRFSRNPIYIGNGLIGLGLSMLSGIVWAPIVFALLFFVQYIPIIRFEEAVLAKEYGDEYLEYKNLVPRWIGISKLSRESCGGDYEVYPSRKIIKSESHTFASIVTIGACMMAHGVF